MASGGGPPPYSAQPTAPPYQAPPQGMYPQVPPPGAYPTQGQPHVVGQNVTTVLPGGRGVVVAGPGQTTIVKGTKTTTVVHEKPKKGGLFSSLGNEFSKAVKTVEKEADYLANKASKTIDSHWDSKELQLFKNGNVVQLVSRVSGRSLQIVQAGNGQLVVDSMGMEGPSAQNAVWTVEGVGNNIVKLHNNHNYLAIVNGCTTLIYFPPQSGYALGTETHFRLQQTATFILFDSVKEPGRHIAVLNTGALKSALASGKEQDAQFGIRLIYTPTVVTPVPAGKH